jgi:hypothetical protein
MVLMENFGWILAALFAGMWIGFFLAGYVQGYRKRDAEQAIVHATAQLQNLTQKIKETRGDDAILAREQAPTIKVSEAEIQSMVADIMRETGVEEKVAREEVDLILAEANAIGQA